MNRGGTHFRTFDDAGFKSVTPKPRIDNEPVTIRVRETMVVVSILVLLLGLLVVVGMLMSQNGDTSSNSAVPRVLANQPAPVHGSVARESSPTTDDPLQASPMWITQTARRSGIAPIAIAAYGDAALRLAHDQPSCHLGWTTLAGVGTVESANGTIGGRAVLANGLSSSPITGPVLNGAGGYAAISNDSGGWSAARGPMQFIQSTWDRWGADGNDDAVTDVNNIFDAAFAAGRYLCADGRDLATAQGWTAGVYSYNHSAPYVAEVYAAANEAAR